ncbi:MAG: imidazole glycerol phosphate synthase subunit HisH [Deltaproteobacteria bacterium]|nr:imidazole glycerol phosphate synthase subunit HisH [Deltaproteobacteria bacterium]MBN2844940.1 imidazole glycerol phosphate synthase subunit HisH [Deltaproteobacteria bacterium]
MISIIDYQAGNLRSVRRALLHLGVPCRITNKPLEILSSERVIFPGVGAAGKAMETIQSLELDEVIREVVTSGTPFLGICLGAQIILEKSEEGDTDCLNLIPGRVRRFPGSTFKIPHMGWNTLEIKQKHPILDGIDEKAQYYFVHSYYAEPARDEDVIATTEYGIQFASIIGRDNIVATQFHLEKSGRQGLSILENFSKWDGWAG